MYEYVKITFHRAQDHWHVAIGTYQANGYTKYPRTVRKPWEHLLSLPVSVHSEEIFRAVRAAIEALPEASDSADGAAVSAPLEGPRGGVSQ